MSTPSTCKLCEGPLPATANGRRVYCSQRCAGRAVGANGARRIRNPPARVTCRLCGTVIETYHRNSVFCSWDCSNKGKGRSYGGGGKDKNHDAIAAMYQAVGALVVDTHRCGKGIPDLLIGYAQCLFWVEVKNPDAQYGRAPLRGAQKAFADTATKNDLPYFVVRTAKDVERSLSSVACTDVLTVADVLDALGIERTP